MKIQEITSYKTTDGKLFPELGAAERHQRELEFMAWYNRLNPDESLLESSDYVVSGGVLASWLKLNRTNVIEYLRE